VLHASEQPGEEVLCRLARGHAEVVPQHAPELVVHHDGCGMIAALGERAHQQAVTDLGQRAEPDEATRTALGAGQFGTRTPGTAQRYGTSPKDNASLRTVVIADRLRLGRHRQRCAPGP
jgi:hypothetical protein